MCNVFLNKMYAFEKDVCFLKRCIKLGDEVFKRREMYVNCIGQLFFEGHRIGRHCSKIIFIAVLCSRVPTISHTCFVVYSEVRSRIQRGCSSQFTVCYPNVTLSYRPSVLQSIMFSCFIHNALYLWSLLGCLSVDLHLSLFLSLYFPCAISLRRVPLCCHLRTRIKTVL